MTINNVKAVITEDVVLRYEQKIEKKKKLPMLELFLQNVEVTGIQFASDELYKRFLKLLGKADFDGKEFYTKVLFVFRGILGLPADCFDTDATLIASDKTEVVFSKLLLTKSYPFFERMFSHTMKETKDGNKVSVQLSPTALATFYSYLYTGKIAPAQSIPDLSELLDFAHMIEDKPLIEQLSEAGV